VRARALAGGVSALAKAARIPQDSMEPLLRSFYEQTTGESGEDVYVRSGVNGELLLSHICLAALLAEGCACCLFLLYPFPPSVPFHLWQ
jgi:hypothetical protein